MPYGDLRPHARAVALIEMHQRVGWRVSRDFGVGREDRAPELRRAQPLELERQEGEFVRGVEYAEVARVLSDAEGVAAKMRELRISDALIEDASIRGDGRVVKDYYLLEVKTPAESRYAWDYLKVVTTVPGEDVTRPLTEGGCPLISGK